jgi:hypothetical protein
MTFEDLPFDDSTPPDLLAVFRTARNVLRYAWLLMDSLVRGKNGAECARILRQLKKEVYDAARTHPELGAIDHELTVSRGRILSAWGDYYPNAHQAAIGVGRLLLRSVYYFANEAMRTTQQPFELLPERFSIETWHHIREEVRNHCHPRREELREVEVSMRLELSKAVHGRKARQAIASEFRGDDKAAGRKKRRRSAERKGVRLTDKQSEAIEVVARHDGNFTKAAKELGISRQGLQNRYDSAVKKCKKENIDIPKARSPKPKLQSLPHDRRGQVDVPDPNQDNLPGRN